MRTLVIYDNAGKIFFKVQGDIQEPVYEDLPKTEVQLIGEQVAALNTALAEIMGG